MTLLRMANVSTQPTDTDPSSPFDRLFSRSGVFEYGVDFLDFSDAILGTGFLQTRFTRAQPGTPAAGLTVFEYRIDLTEVERDRRSVSTFSVDFDSLVDYLDYDFDGSPEPVFVITEGGLGTVAPRSADKEGRRITFTFDPP